MGDFPREAGGEEREPCRSEGPDFGENVVVDEGDALDLPNEAGDEPELCFGTAICLVSLISTCPVLLLGAGAEGGGACLYLRFMKDILRDLALQDLGRRRLLQDSVLP